MGILSNITNSDLERRGLTHKQGLYILQLKEVVVRKSRQGNQYINLRFTPETFAEERGAEMGDLDHKAPLFDMIVPVTDSGVNPIAASRTASLISALTGIRDADKIREEYDADSVSELGKKLSNLVSLRCKSFVSLRKEVDQNSNPVMRNRIGSYEPLSDEELSSTESDDDDSNIPF